MNEKYKDGDNKFIQNLSFLKSKAMIENIQSEKIDEINTCAFCGSCYPVKFSTSSCSSSSGISNDSEYNYSMSKTDPLLEKVTTWLNDNPEFAREYFMRHATKSMVESWKTFHSINSRCQVTEGDVNASQVDRSSSKSGSGSNTPVRKISSQEFDLVGLRPIFSTNSDGTITFITPDSVHATTNNYLSTTASPRRSRRRRSAYKHLDEHEFMKELIKDLCDDLDLTSLGFKILQNVSLLLYADRCSLFLVEYDYRTDQKFLVSKLFDVTTECTLEETVNKCTNHCIKIPLGHGIMGHVAQSGQYENIADVYQDDRFNNEVDKLTGYRTKCLLCMPLKDSNGTVLGVAQAVNKVDNYNQNCFSSRDVKVFQSYLSFCGMSIRNAQIYRQSQLETRRNQVLLDLARLIFEEQSSMKRLMFKIMMHTQSLLQCERVQIFLVGNTNQEDNKVFTSIYEYSELEVENEDDCEATGTPRYPINIGITGYVAKTGETVDIDCAYEDFRFDKSVEENSPFRTRSILCMPIKNAAGEVICVCQLTNKIRGQSFTQTDKYLFEAFGLFCGLGIHNTHMYEDISKAMAKQRITLEVLSYHAIAPIEEAARFSKMLIPSVRYYQLNQFTFTDFNMTDDDTIKGCIRMFMDLNLINDFNIDYIVLCRWLLSVRKNYRNVTYHNWRHAFNVAQIMYSMIQTGKLKSVLSNLEILALIIACLCHDLDHRGTNNQFQVKSMSPLAELYSTSVLEHHHFDQCVMILSTKGSDILCNLHQQDYQKIMEMIESAILATDLAMYFQKRKTFFDIVSRKPQVNDWSDDEERSLLKAMCMTTCDVAAITKPWDVQKKIAELVASEFFEQGDLEKSELNMKPIAMMDRDRKDELPKLQVEFIDQICLPLYKAMKEVSLNLSPLLDGCIANRENWQSLWLKTPMPN